MKTFLDRLEWRYATKAFDPSKPASEADVAKVLQAIRMAPTSFGLQPFHVRVVTDATTKERICAAGWNQKQYSTASHVLVFIADTDVPKRIDQILEISAGGDPAKREALKGYESMMRGFFGKMSQGDRKHWAAKQAYIALGFAMAACAEIGLDSCPMEGFAPAEVDKILGVPETEGVCVILTLGQRAEGEKPRAKVRLSEKELFRKS